MRWGRPNIQPYYEYEYQPATGWLSAARYGRVVGSQKISSDAYAVENLTYDENGNILTLKRRGTSEAPDMDKLAYTYEAASNQLAYVADEVAPGAYPNDLDGQQPNNYEYNKIGQLIFNKQDDVGYEYYTSGLTKAIYNGRVESGTKRVEFQYNESGHRIKKLSYNQEGTLLKTTFYVRDAAGTPLAIYYKDEGNTDKSIILAEQVVYGSSRIGTLNRTTETMLYEITDHLGNVRALVTKGENGQPIAVLGTADYYPGGMEFPDENSLDYRYGYQGEYAEKDEETGLNAFELRMYDPRINRWITPDPKRQYASPYMAMGNNWSNRVDPDGGYDTRREARQARRANREAAIEERSNVKYGSIRKLKDGTFSIDKTFEDGRIVGLTSKAIVGYDKKTLYRIAKSNKSVNALSRTISYTDGLTGMTIGNADRYAQKHLINKGKMINSNFKKYNLYRSNGYLNGNQHISGTKFMKKAGKLNYVAKRLPVLNVASLSYSSIRAVDEEHPGYISQGIISTLVGFVPWAGPALSVGIDETNVDYWNIHTSPWFNNTENIME